MNRPLKISAQEMGRIEAADYSRSAGLVPVVVVLDNVRSKNNIGSIFRTADAMGIRQIYCCGFTATPPDRDIHKTALGAEQSVPFAYFEDIQAALTHLQAAGYALYAVEQAHGSLQLGRDPIATHSPIALIMGNEIEGVQEAVLQRCDAFIEIPQYGSKHSLNVSCAAAIALWEITQTIRSTQ